MVIGVTMIKIVPDHEKASYEALREVEGVKEIYHLFGEFDFFLILEAQDRKGLERLLGEIRAVKFVVDTWSLLVAKEIGQEAHPSIGASLSPAKILAAI